MFGPLYSWLPSVEAMLREIRLDTAKRFNENEVSSCERNAGDRCSQTHRRFFCTGHVSV